MISKIRRIERYYSNLEYILPEEMIHNNITEELEKAKNEMKTIIEEDLKNIQVLARNEKKAIAVNKISKPSSIIKMAFSLEEDQSQDRIAYQYAHWIMSLSSLQLLAQDTIDLSAESKRYYINYIKATGHEKRIAFGRFVQTYGDFNGYLINLHNMIVQYYDSFILTCNEIDPNHTEQTVIAHKSDITHDQLLAATKELLLRGNYGRLAGFVLLRSAVEVFITRELFDLKKSQKYSTREITFPGKDIPSMNSIWKRIENLNLGQYFKTDSLKRLYGWESIVAHRGYLAEEYLIWFVYQHTAKEIIGAFGANLKQNGDQILEALERDGIIKIK